MDEAATGLRSTRRGAVACRRCRRLRSKCIHDCGLPPCDGCRRAGSSTAASCSFPRRGEQDTDRHFRAKRPKAAEAKVSAQSDVHDQSPDPAIQGPQAAHSSPRSADIRGPIDGTLPVSNVLPPQQEVVDGCRAFTTSYFQLGFVPKALFLERLSNDKDAINTFLLVCILAISARFTPTLITRYGTASRATTYFLRVASEMVPQEMYEVSLERVQAFFLLSIAEWGNGDKHRSTIHMGIAVKMAAILGLHREETYKLSPSATRDAIVESEVARRTFWMLQSQDNLHSGHKTPVSFSPGDITALLPCDENEFAFGLPPQHRASLAGTAAATRDPSSTSPPQRSLFATLIQAHNLWGIVARRACRTEQDSAGLTRDPADSLSEYRMLAEDLRVWEASLPAHHQWSVWNLRGYKAENLELAYLAIVMVVRMSNIVLRRIYLDNLIAASHNKFDPHQTSDADFWRTMSHELFANVSELYQQIDAYFPSRLREQGHPAILAFCVYVCGSVAAYLWRWPNLCLHHSAEAETIATRSLAVLSELQHAWPAASRWQIGLAQATSPVTGERRSSTTDLPCHDGTIVGHATMNTHRRRQPSCSAQDRDGAGESHVHGTAAPDNAPLQAALTEAHNANAMMASDVSPRNDTIGAFEAELAALLQGDFVTGFNGGWELPTSF